MTISDLQGRKLDVAFDHFDVDRDELVQRGDFAELGARFLLGFGDGPDSRRGQDLVDHFDQVWFALATQISTDSELDSLSRGDFRAGMDAAFITGDRFTQVLRPAARAVIRLSDTDADGLISLPEFTTMQRAYGTDERHIREAFDSIDADGDGRLSTEELEKAMHDFYVGRRPTAPGNWLFGPI